MRIVITGALGHIGSRLIREMPLAFPGAELALINHYSSQRYYSLSDLPDSARYQFFGLDVSKEDLNPIIEGADAVIHLASRTRTHGGPLGEEVEKRNLATTQRVAHACLANGAPLILLSTASVYGPSKSEVDEACPASDLNPQNDYAQNKLREEALIQTLGKTENLKFTILRLGTIFGYSPGMRFDTAVNKFCWQATLGLPVTVWTTAMEQTRPYLDVVDAVRAMIFLIEKRVFDNQIYNIHTLNTTVSKILSVIRRDIPDFNIQFVNEKKMNTLSYQVLNHRFRKLGFDFTGNLELGIGAVLAKIKSIRNITPQAMRQAG